MKYEIIYADPPWSYRSVYQNQSFDDSGSAKYHYNTMSIGELCAMRPYIDSVVAENCLLFMWVTSPTLTDAMKLIEAWGFEYKTIAFCWDKMRTNTSYYTLSQVEMCLVSKRGKIPQPRGSRNELQFLTEKTKQHSRKPDEFRRRIERMFPEQRKIELFARVQFPGWDVYGNEVEKFNECNVLEELAGT